LPLHLPLPLFVSVVILSEAKNPYILQLYLQLLFLLVIPEGNLLLLLPLLLSLLFYVVILTLREVEWNDRRL